MGGLAGVLGYDRIASSIAEELAEGTKISLIQGPPGVGKSWLAKGIGSLWEEGGGSTLVAEGEELQRDADFYPLKFALAALTGSWRTVGADLAQISAAGERIAGTAGVLTATIQALVRLRPSRQRARKLYLGPDEQEVLFQLERLAKNKPLLLIVDNLHWWDAESLKILGRLIEPAMGEAFPFLTEMRLIAVQTVEPYQRTANPEARDALLRKGHAHPHQLERPPLSSFSDVLTALDAPPRQAADYADRVFHLTGGHLLPTARCAKRMRKEGSSFSLTASNEDEFTRELFSDRIRSLGPVGANAMAILQIAAALGMRFRRAEVMCAFGGETSEVSKLLRDCRDEDMIELSEEFGKFVHDLVREHFRKSGTLDETGIHESISDCLRRLRPGAYILRCRHAQRAERERQAGIFGAQAALQHQRDGLPWRELPEDVLAAVENAGMAGIVQTFGEALEHLNSNRVSDCLQALSGVRRNIRPLAAEVDYLKATCLLSARSEVDRENAQAMLEQWADLVKEEPELGMRLMHLRLFALTLLVDKAPGRTLEGEINQALLDRGEFDRDAEDTSFILDRCSGSLHEPEASLPRVREAAEYFGPARGQSVIRKPVEYFRCMVNLGAKQLTTARYEEAQVTYRKLEELIAEYAPGTFPRLDFPRSGALLVEYRLGSISPEEAAHRQAQIAVENDVEGDPFYCENALAVYLTLSGAAEQALQIFDRLDENLVQRAKPAPSMLYLIQTNRCATRYVTGNHESALAEWLGLTEVCERIPYLIGRYLLARHKSLAEVMQKRESASPVEFDECLLGESRFGQLWDQLGRGFRMPEVEWWH